MKVSATIAASLFDSRFDGFRHGGFFDQFPRLLAYERELVDGNLREVFDKGGHDIPIFVPSKVVELVPVKE